MSDPRGGENGGHGPQRRPEPTGLTTWQWFTRLVLVLTFGTLVLGIGKAVHQFGFESPKDRAIEEARLRTEIERMRAAPNGDATGIAIQKIMNVLRDEGLDMKGISIPNVVLKMAVFEDVDWTSADMTGTEFLCSDEVYHGLGPFSPPDVRFEPCARFRDADFLHTTLDHALFDYADLRDADFERAYLRVAEIRGAVATGANFVLSVLPGIRIFDSDFAGVEFGSAPDFGCHEEEDYECSELRNVDLSGAVMPKARFLGTWIVDVDFARADLEGAGFRCHDQSRPRSCGSIYGACFAGTNLADVEFEDLEITNADFSGATMTGVLFRNVRFSSVVFPRALMDSASFDGVSRKSLEEALRYPLDHLNEDERPCTATWRHRLGEIRDRFVFGERG